MTGQPSSELQAFVAESIDRPPILEFMQSAASARIPGSRVLDAGAGSAPYGELFDHCDHVTTDWQESVHEGGRQADVVASLEDLPLDDGCFDAVILYPGPKHVEDPVTVLGELRRVLAGGGRLWITVPLVWELHEEPHDYYRYTAHGVASLLGRAGYGDVQVQAFGGYFSTLAHLLGAAARPPRPADGSARFGHRSVTAAMRAAAPAVRGPPPRPARPPGSGP